MPNKATNMHGTLTQPRLNLRHVATVMVALVFVAARMQDCCAAWRAGGNRDASVFMGL